MTLNDILAKHNIEPKSAKTPEELKNTKSPIVAVSPVGEMKVSNIDSKNSSLPVPPPNPISNPPKAESKENGISWNQMVAQKSQSVMKDTTPFPELSAAQAPQSGMDAVKGFLGSIVAVEDTTRLLNILERRWGKEDLKDNMDLAKIITKIGANFIQKLGEMSANPRYPNGAKSGSIQKTAAPKPVNIEEALLIL